MDAAISARAVAFRRGVASPGASTCALANDRMFRTVNLQMIFLKVGRTHPLIIEARVVARTRQIITVRAEFRHDDGALIADATAQQILLAFENWPAEQAAIEAMA